MSLADRLAATPDTPPPTRPRPEHASGYEWDGTTGYIQTGPLQERPRTWDAFIRDAGLDPDEVEVVEPVQVRGWDMPQAGGGTVRAHYYRLTIRRCAGARQDIESLMRLARRARRTVRTPKDKPRQATIVGYADGQTGKVASRGGTKELLERVQVTLGLLEKYVRKVGSDEAYLLDVGDAIEGFENTASQQFTNDLSLPRQVEIATDVLFEFTDLLAKHHDKVTVAGIGSNHCQWRAGKGVLGTPADDWGIHMLRQLGKALRLNDTYSHVTVRWPGEYEETLALDVCGVRVGLAHGHQARRPEAIPTWWAGQSHGAQPVGQCEILVTGHFHSFRTQPSGRDAWSNRERRWFQCPTLDNGSDWFRHTSGEDSDPGLLVFTVSEEGWSNLEVLRP